MTAVTRSTIADSGPRTTSDDMVRCAIVIPTYNGAALTGTCLESLLASPPATCRWTIVVVDDGSDDGTADALARFGSQVRLVEQGVNTGFARACNAGAQAAGDCEHLVFLNNDTLPTAGWLDALVEEARADPRVAAVGAKLLYPTGQVQHAGVAIGEDRWPHHLYAGFDGEHPAVNRSRFVSAATAACLLVRRADFAQLGGFDPAFHNGFEDVDLCLRLGQLGRLIRYCARSVVYHLESVTRWPSGAPEGVEESTRLFDERWRSKIAPDDLRHYLDDGLLNLSYGAHYPLTVGISPHLAAVRRDGEALAGLERLLSVRSQQVMELMSIETRHQLRERAEASPPWLAPRRRVPQGRRLTEGREHVLGEPGSRHFISVVMPVKNGAAHLSELLPAILGQSFATRLEIVAVDSGSDDETIAVLERFGATILSVDAADFDHGLTRNLVAEQARGDVLVFLSQRARPIGDRWLAPLIAALDEDPVVAGVCSRVIPRAEADLLTRKDGERDLSASAERQRKQVNDWSAYVRMSAENRRVLLNFHTVSAAIRKEAWLRTPFRAVRTIGEDLLWARETLEGGWALVHEPESVVQHSHSYSLTELFSRNVDDGIANRDVVERSLEGEQVIPLIRALVNDDWGYLRDELRLSGPELEQWQLESALRRAAQIAGQYVGINYEQLPEGTATRFSSVVASRTRAQQERAASH